MEIGCLLQDSVWLRKLTIFLGIPGSLHSSVCFSGRVLHFTNGRHYQAVLGKEAQGVMACVELILSQYQKKFPGNYVPCARGRRF